MIKYELIIALLKIINYCNYDRSLYITIILKRLSDCYNDDCIKFLNILKTYINNKNYLDIINYIIFKLKTNDNINLIIIEQNNFIKDDNITKYNAIHFIKNLLQYAISDINIQQIFNSFFDQKQFKVNLDNILIFNFLKKECDYKDIDIKILYGILMLQYIQHTFNIKLESFENNGIFNIENILQTISILSDIDIITIRNYYLNENNIINIELAHPDTFIKFFKSSYLYLMEIICRTANSHQFIYKNDILLPFFKQPKDNNFYDINTFNISKNDINLLKNIFKKQTKSNILIYGEPGLGKTEFVKSLFNTCKIKFINFEFDYFKLNFCPEFFEPENNNNKNLFANLFPYVNKIASVYKQAIFIDEADAFLNTKQYYNEKTLEKQTINKFLDNNETHIIWVVNDIFGIQESTLRRFDHIINFINGNDNYKIKIWKNKLKEYNIKFKFSNKEISNFIKKYNKLPISYISKIINNAKINSNNLNKKKFISNINEIANSIYKNIFNENAMSETKINLNKIYSLKTLNTDCDINEIINSIKKFNKLSNPSMGCTLLLNGEPGTGKTEFAKYLSKILKKDILIRRYSDLSSMFVGETEHNIAKIFNKASKENKILLIDEADSFFSTREHAERVWEKTMVNEMLTQMENFKGIFICSTNLLNDFDNASMRRFLWKIKFNYLTFESSLMLCKKYFNINNFSEKFQESLNKLNNLTHGDIRNVYNKLFFKNNYNEDDIINNLQNEISYKTKKHVGF